MSRCIFIFVISFLYIYIYVYLISNAILIDIKKSHPNIYRVYNKGPYNQLHKLFGSIKSIIEHKGRLGKTDIQSNKVLKKMNLRLGIVLFVLETPIVPLPHIHHIKQCNPFFEITPKRLKGNCVYWIRFCPSLIENEKGLHSLGHIDLCF